MSKEKVVDIGVIHKDRLGQAVYGDPSTCQAAGGPAPRAVAQKSLPGPPDTWQPIATAPKGTRVLVWGNGGIRFGYIDELDRWRASHHGPLRGTPTHWMPLPNTPRL